MSTCPEKDIHSIYLDNELPAAYVAEYEAHVNSCPECKARLEKMRAMHSVFAADRKNMALSEEMLDKSYERLQARLSYSRVTKTNIHTFDAGKLTSRIISGAAGAAVAAVLAVIILPGRVQKTKGAAVSPDQFQPVARVQINSPAMTDVKVDGQITPATLADFLGSSSADYSDYSYSGAIMGTTVGTKSGVLGAIPNSSVYGMPYFERKEVKETQEQRLRSNLTSYDVFSPLVKDQDINAAAKGQEITIHFNSSLGYISLEIGSQN